MSDNYDKLTPAEQAYWNIYARLRELSDWPGFTDTQRNRKDIARNWLVERRKEIWRLAQDKGDGHGWDFNNRRERWEQLKDENLNTAEPNALCQLPTTGNMPGEKSLISEREMWWRQMSVDDQTRAWRLENVESLGDIRKRLYTLAEQDGWHKLDRRDRWKNLCVATKTGRAYDAWSKTHNETTGELLKPELSPRQKFIVNCRNYLGVKESPAGSNKGEPQPSGWQERVYGDDGVAWCACFVCCMAWDVGAKGAGSAGVIVCMDLAQRGQGMFRGWTTDPRRVRPGDFAVVGCRTCHIGGVVDWDDPCHLIEGNGNDGGSYNGGEVVDKRRGRHEIIGWCLVDYPS